MAPGYRRALGPNAGYSSVAIKWEDMTSIGEVHVPVLHGTLSEKTRKQDISFFFPLERYLLWVKLAP